MYLNLILFTTEAMLTAKNANNSKVKRIKESEALKVKQFEDFVGGCTIINHLWIILFWGKVCQFCSG